MTVDAPDLSAIYDIPTLLENSMGDCEFAEELLERFQARLVSSRHSLETHVQDGDLATAAAVAHSLKGEAGILAASQVHSVAQRLELALQNLGDAAVVPLLNELKAASDRCLNAYTEARTAIHEYQLSNG